MVKAVIFDLDDTLISEKDYIISGYYHIAEIIEEEFDINRNIVFKDMMELFKISPQNVFDRLNTKYNIEFSNDMICDLVNEYREHLPKIQYYNDVLPCLAKLKHSGLKLGIITDGYAITQRQKLKVIKAKEYFDEIIITDELGNNFWKPHPRAFELMKKKLNVQFKEMVYVGDNPKKDFYIRKTYPIITIRILRDGIYKDKLYLENTKENYLIENLTEIESILGFNNIWYGRSRHKNIKKNQKRGVK